MPSRGINCSELPTCARREAPASGPRGSGSPASVLFARSLPQRIDLAVLCCIALQPRRQHSVYCRRECDGLIRRYCFSISLLSISFCRSALPPRFASYCTRSLHLNSGAVALSSHSSIGTNRESGGAGGGDGGGSGRLGFRPCVPVSSTSQNERFGVSSQSKYGRALRPTAHRHRC